MLIKITDKKGNDWHVNPLYIKSVREKKPGRTEVIGSFLNMGASIQTDEPATDIADRISIALAAMNPAAFTAIETEQRQQQAAAAAAAG